MDDREFEHWKDAIDKICQKRIGCSIDDLPDYGYQTAFDSCLTPNEAFHEVIAEASDLMGCDNPLEVK